MGSRTSGWFELDSDEWTRGSWPARCLREPDGPAASELVGTLILTNHRLVFVDHTQLDEVASVRFEELTSVRCTRRGLFLNTLIVETSSQQLFVFRTKKIACTQIEARSHMRSLNKR